MLLTGWWGLLRRGIVANSCGTHQTLDTITLTKRKANGDAIHLDYPQTHLHCNAGRKKLDCLNKHPKTNYICSGCFPAQLNDKRAEFCDDTFIPSDE